MKNLIFMSCTACFALTYDVLPSDALRFDVLQATILHLLLLHCGEHLFCIDFWCINILPLTRMDVYVDQGIDGKAGEVKFKQVCYI